MSAGQLRHKVQLLTPTEGDDDRGGQPTDWQKGPELWADVRNVSAREQAIAGAVQSLATHVVAVHYNPAITVEQRLARVSPCGADLQILGIRDLDGRQRWMELDCSEAVSNVE